MSDSIGYLSGDDLQIKCQFEILSLLELHLTAAVNNHTTLYFKALIPLESESVRVSNQNVVLNNIREDVTVFNGVISKCRKQKVGELLYLEMTCKSRSWLLDFDPHSNTFQNRKELHNDVLKRLFSRSGAASIVQNDEPIDPPIWQFKETDWKFTKRIAAIMGTVVVADYSLDIPYISVGFPKRKPLAVFPSAYDTEIQYFDGYSKFEPENQLENNFKCGVIYKLGDTLTIHDQDKYVMNVYLKLVDGILECAYSLGKMVAPERKQKINQDAEGVILVGTVLNSTGEMLKVHFDIDESQPANTAMWLPYMPDTSNVFYSMPEIGARVAARFKHESAVVITSLHEEGINMYPSSTDKIFNIPRGQQMAMLQRGFFFNDCDNKLSIADSDGVLCSSAQKIHLLAKNDITANTQKGIELRSPEQVKFNKSGTPDGIDLSANEIKIYSNNTKLVSCGEEPMPPPLRMQRNNEVVDVSMAAAIIASSVARLNPNRR